MSIILKKWLYKAAMTLAAVAALPVGAQEAFPARPVTLIVNFPPGGVTDGTFRRMSDRFKTMTGQSLRRSRPGRRSNCPSRKTSSSASI